MLCRLLPLCAALALALPAAADEVVATEKPVRMPANTGKPDAFTVPPGFQVERIYFVPKEKFGSWVNITTDPKGRLICQRPGEEGPVPHHPRPAGDRRADEGREARRNITAAQGLLFAFDSLYVSVNGGPGSGLYRVRDDTATTSSTRSKKLKEIRGGGEHGPHALRLTPDGKSICRSAGNFTQPPENFQHSRLPKNWGEDLLLPRHWDGQRLRPRPDGAGRLGRAVRPRRQDLGDGQRRLPQHLRLRLQRRRRAVHLRRRHGMGHGRRRGTGPPASATRPAAASSAGAAAPASGRRTTSTACRRSSTSAPARRSASSSATARSSRPSTRRPCTSSTGRSAPSTPCTWSRAAPRTRRPRRSSSAAPRCR